jgi:hypothetical protein
MVLEQGIWPEGHLVAPSEEALRREVELVKRLGFNGARLHQKIEDPRFLKACDQLGLLVWEELPSCYTYNETSMVRLARQWTEVVTRDRSHPCVVCWVPLNESWGVPDLPLRQDQRNFARSLVHLTRALDDSRLVISNDGWEHLDSDIWTVHDYSPDPLVLQQRYGTPQAVDRVLNGEWPAGHAIVLERTGAARPPVMVSEFGGISLDPAPGAAWSGYATFPSETALTERFRALVEALLSCRPLAGLCYTQLTDTFQETNGILRSDRSPKIPFEIVHAALTGSPQPLAVDAGELHPSAPDATTSPTTPLTQPDTSDVPGP